MDNPTDRFAALVGTVAEYGWPAVTDRRRFFGMLGAVEGATAGWGGSHLSKGSTPGPTPPVHARAIQSRARNIARKVG